MVTMMIIMVIWSKRVDLELLSLPAFAAVREEVGELEEEGGVSCKPHPGKSRAVGRGIDGGWALLHRLQRGVGEGGGGRGRVRRGVEVFLVHLRDCGCELH